MPWCSFVLRQQLHRGFCVLQMAPHAAPHLSPCTLRLAFSSVLQFPMMAPMPRAIAIATIMTSQSDAYNPADTVDTVLKPQFNTYDPARIQSHPGISTELSQTPPEEILVTDFFGGVASVEITPKEAELDMLRAEVPRWEASPRRKTIGRGMEVAWARSTGQRADVPVRETVGGAWKRPLERTRQGVVEMGMGLKEMGVVVGLVGVVYLLLRPQTGKET